MDLGATICGVTRPSCSSCPLDGVCASAAIYRESRPSRKVAERPEPYRGSRRHLRGQIVAVLRAQDHGAVVSVDDLARSIATNSAEVDPIVIEDLARGLEVDGLARIVVEDGRTLVGPPV
jgi:adenine-specific DNA glycosylase